MAKRNNKGFTMVELLAAVVILGILLVFAVPRIFGLLTNNKNRIYINDAKKLITQAEYKMKANSSNIEKPDEDNAIVMSLKYLYSKDFHIKILYAFI